MSTGPSVVTNIRAKPSSTIVRAKVRRLIQLQMAPGEKLPSEADLADRFGVSRNTVREALEELQTLGLVQRRWGHGTFVSAGFSALQKQLNELAPIPEVVRRSGKVCGLELFAYRMGTLPLSMRFHEPTSDFERVWELERIYSADGVNFIYLRDFLPASLNGISLDPSKLKDSIRDLTQGQWGTSFSFATAEITAIAAPRGVAAKLGVKPGSPVMRDHQYLYTVDNIPLACTESFLRTDVISLQITRRYTAT